MYRRFINITLALQRHVMLKYRRTSTFQDDKLSPHVMCWYKYNKVYMYIEMEVVFKKRRSLSSPHRYKYELNNIFIWNSGYTRYLLKV